MIDPDRLTVKAQQAIGQAQSLASSLEQQEIDVEHLLSALVGQREGVVPPLLQKLGVRLETLEAEIRRDLEARPRVSGAREQYASARLNEVLDAAWQIAQGFSDEYLSAEHILLAILHGGGRGAQILSEFGSTRRSRGLRATSRPRRGRASWTRLSAETTRSGG
jgi:ATP-dependent Clp protease ATP-binding subunit ClpB